MQTLGMTDGNPIPRTLHTSCTYPVVRVVGAYADIAVRVSRGVCTVLLFP